MSKSKSKRPLNDGSLALSRTYEVEHEEERDTSPLRSGRLKLVPRHVPEPETRTHTTGDLYDPSLDTTPRLREHVAAPPISSGAPITDKLDDAPLSAHPSGIGEHAARVRMVPTVGARVRTGLRRSTLLVLLAVAVAGALVASGYLLATTPWLANLTGSAPPATINEAPPLSGPATDTAPVQPPGQTGAKDVQLSHSDLPAPQPPSTAAKAARDQALEAYKQGNYAQAVQLFEGYVLVSGDDAEAYYHLGMAYMALAGQEHSMADSELAFRTAISLQPTWAAPYQGLAENLMRRSSYQEAISPAQKATELAPAAPEVWLTLGRAYQGAGREADAARAFSQASYLAPSPPLP